MRGYLAVPLAISLVVLPGFALATEADLPFDADTAVALTAGTVYIGSGSKLSTMTVATSTLTVTVGTGGDTFILKDTQATRRMMFLVDGILTATCNETQSSITLTNSATTTYVLQPTSDSLCTTTGSSSGSGGGGGGGGGGASPSPAPTPAPTPTPTTTPETTTPATVPPSATAGAHANGTLILDSDGTIYLIVNGAKRGFRNPEEYFSHGYKFSQAVPANDTDRALPNESQAIEKALDGTLALDKTDNRTIYMIAAGKKRGFTSAEVFFALGYKFDQAVAIDLSDYEAAEPIDSAALPHPNGALVLQSNGTVWWILNGQRQGFQSAEVFFTYGFTFDKVVPANDADLALSEGPLVKYRDGTLINDGGVYFLISDGKKKSFASVEALTNAGYKAENAISASLAAYEDGGSM